MDRLIDVHSHLPIGGPPTERPWTAAGAIEAMDQHGIATQLLSLPHIFVSGPLDSQPAAQAARSVNEHFAGIVGEHPDRFGAFACLPADSSDAALAELEYALDVLHLDGVAVSSNTQGRYLGHAFFEPVLTELDRRQTPMFVHPWRTLRMSRTSRLAGPRSSSSSRSTPREPPPTPSMPVSSSAILVSA